MAITFVAAGAEGGSSAGTTVAPGLPAGISANDILICAYAGQGNGGAVSMVAGWTKLCDAVTTNGPNFGVWWWRYDGVTSPSTTVTDTGSSAEPKIAGIAAFRGCKQGGTDPFNIKQTATATASTATSASSPSLTTTKPNCMLFSVCGIDDGEPIVRPTGMTSAFEDANAGVDDGFIQGTTTTGATIGLAYAAQAAAGASGAKQWTGLIGGSGFGDRLWMGALEPENDTSINTARKLEYLTE